MSYFGKEYKFVSEENYDNFVKSWVPPGKYDVFVNYRPVVKIVQNGDTYTLSRISPEFTSEVTFKSGVEFEEKLRSIDAKSTITVDGNVVTQVQKFPNGNAFTFKAEYSDDDLVVTITTAQWDGVAKRYYKA